MWITNSVKCINDAVIEGRGERKKKKKKKDNSTAITIRHLFPN